MFEIKLEGIEEALKKSNPDIVRKAANMSINDVSKQGITEAGNQIKEEYNIKSSRISPNLKLTTRAKGYSLEAVITGRGRGLPLSYFDAKQEGVVANKKGFRYTRKAIKSGWQKRGGQITVLVKRAGGRKVVNEDPKPFIVRLKSGHIAVMQRTGKERKPIKQKYGPGIGLLFGSTRIMKATIAKINEKFKPRFEYWLDRFTNEAK